MGFAENEPSGGGGGDVYTDVENVFVEDQQIGEPGDWGTDNGNQLLVYQANGDSPNAAISFSWMVDNPAIRCMHQYIDSAGYSAIWIGYSSSVNPWVGGRAIWRSFGMFFGSGGGFGLTSSADPFGSDSDVRLKRSAANLWGMCETQGNTGGCCMEALNVTDVPAASANSAGWGAEGGEFVVFDSAGNETIVSPHARDAPRPLYSQEPGREKVVRTIHKCDKGREVRWHNETRTAINVQFLIEKLAAAGDPDAIDILKAGSHISYVEESLDEYNERNPDRAKQAMTWEDREALLEVRHEAAQDIVAADREHLEKVQQAKQASIDAKHAKNLVEHAAAVAEHEFAVVEGIADAKDRPVAPTKAALEALPEKPERVKYVKQSRPAFLEAK